MPDRCVVSMYRCLIGALFDSQNTIIQWKKYDRLLGVAGEVDRGASISLPELS